MMDSKNVEWKLLPLSVKTHHRSLSPIEGRIDLVRGFCFQFQSVGCVIGGSYSVSHDIIIMVTIFADEVIASLAVSCAVEQHFCFLLKNIF